MRIVVIATAIVFLGEACANAITAGPLGEGSVVTPSITSVDSAVPPKHATIQIDQPGYVALLLVAPGHSATLLYPRDSVTGNRFEAGVHQLAFQIPDLLVETDSMRLVQERARGRDTSRVARRPTRGRMISPLPPATPTFLLVITSPQPLHHQRIIEKTLGVSIPTLETEALNAVGKAVKSTIANEPREWAGYYRLVEFRRNR